MYHAHLKGTHYEIGFHWGSLLEKHGHFILNNLPFPIKKERKAFALACVPVYQKYFPEILEEIQGLADGQHCEAEMLQAVLFSMYAIPPACHCSCFAVADHETILFGRNSDFLTELEKYNLNVIYHIDADSYGFTGNTTAFLELEDGINEQGLAVGLTAVYPHAIQPGLNAGMLLRFILEKCKSTNEAIHYIQEIPIASAQTLTIADRIGEIAVVECNAEKIEIIRPSEGRPYVYATNVFHSEAMASFTNPEIDNWQAETRYQTLKNALERKRGQIGIQSAQELLAGKDGFLCQYDRSTGKDTVWSVIYDLKNVAIYRAEGNPCRCNFKKDDRFRFGIEPPFQKH